MWTDAGPHYASSHRELLETMKACRDMHSYGDTHTVRSNGAAGSGEAGTHAPAVEAGAWRLLAEVAAQAHGAPDWAFLQVRRAFPLMDRQKCKSSQGSPC
jgi:hypothetical protein